MIGKAGGTDSRGFAALFNGSDLGKSSSMNVSKFRTLISKPSDESEVMKIFGYVMAVRPC